MPTTKQLTDQVNNLSGNLADPDISLRHGWITEQAHCALAQGFPNCFGQILFLSLTVHI